MGMLCPSGEFLIFSPSCLFLQRSNRSGDYGGHENSAVSSPFNVAEEQGVSELQLWHVKWGIVTWVSTTALQPPPLLYLKSCTCMRNWLNNLEPVASHQKIKGVAQRYYSELQKNADETNIFFALSRSSCCCI